MAIVTIELPDAQAAALQVHADSLGLTLQDWLRELALRSGSNAVDWSQCEAVESVPGKMSGAWVLKGTRMPVATIFENIEAGASIGDVIEWFEGLDRKQVEAVIEFAALSLQRPPDFG